MKHGTWNMNHETWNMNHETWSMKHGTWNKNLAEIWKFCCHAAARTLVFLSLRLALGTKIFVPYYPTPSSVATTRPLALLPDFFYKLLLRCPLGRGLPTSLRLALGKISLLTPFAPKGPLWGFPLYERGTLVIVL